MIKNYEQSVDYLRWLGQLIAMFDQPYPLAVPAMAQGYDAQIAYCRAQLVALGLNPGKD